MQAYFWIADSRDQYTEERLADAMMLYRRQDLAPDLTNCYNQDKSIEPRMKRMDAKAEGHAKHFQPPEDRAKLDGTSKFILCASSMTSCPSYWWNQEYYIVPDGLMQACCWIADSHDQHTEECLAWVNDTMMLYRRQGIIAPGIARRYLRAKISLTLVN